ncbi:MAG TPA: hypothetical protein VHQ01_01840, partial [Pyrinomonadaceae bacterium]|nr:hypothetical protein [Pyrinomonadaceae bacterium]
MKNTSLILTIVIALLLLTARAFAQGSILARGNPPLTQEMVGRLITVYESVLDIKFNASQRARFQQGTVQYWTGHNDAGISNS